MSSPLSALANIISSGVQTLEGAYAKDGLAFPSLDDPFVPTPLDADAALVGAKALIVAAAAQIIATVRSPIETLQVDSLALYYTVTLEAAVEYNVADIIKEAGPQGLHVKDISAKNGIDPSYLARILRFLATRHTFREVGPNVFANNRISSLLIKAKSLKEIKDDPVGKFDDAPIASFVSTSADEALKSSVFFSSYLQNPGTAAAPFNIAYKTDAKMWEFYEEPGNEWRSRRFAAAMKGGADRFPAEIFINGVNTRPLKADDVIVDVGGNLGSATLMLLKEFPHLRYVVQDLERPIVEAEKFWEANGPEAIASGRVKLQAHDFFTAQPVKGAAIYFLRFIVHDWPDHDAKRILSHLRAAADADSKLMLFDTFAVHTCESPAAPSPNRKAPAVPYPLLSNLGVAGAGVNTSIDMQMLNLFNGKERTEEEFREIGNATGWKLEIATPGMLGTFVFSAA